MVQNLEKTRAMVRNTVSRASTISAEEHQLTLTKKDFVVIKRKMDKIDQRLDELYKTGMLNIEMLSLQRNVKK